MLRNLQRISVGSLNLPLNKAVSSSDSASIAYLIFPDPTLEYGTTYRITGSATSVQMFRSPLAFHPSPRRLRSLDFPLVPLESTTRRANSVSLWYPKFT
ncbi:hypothetical protein HO173_008664 [Letharia columbiana]|uniref:Uncharacterized protein n=1 Tax=Letharia columbiana TaxID=112416 RepID=A0A8H6FR00_9LECA|nr:uncharacterized protein HO173_008664 [Letharia columbiana]KAF6233120.1 hypothetical protein HO173_008664 [Letharia columbiana]